MSRLAVVVVTHDSTPVLPRTLGALVPQLREDDELVVVDCGSADDPASVVPSRARFVALGENRGFAGGAVVGAQQTSASVVFFLNPDCVPSPGCLDAIREAPAGWGAWQALVLLPGGERVNTSGNVVHFLGFGWAGGHDEPSASVSPAPAEVGFASGAALAVRRAAWDEVGGFDPAFFMYGEDLDLSLKLRLRGWRVGVVPAARVEHDYEFEKGDYKWFHLERNRWWIVLGTYPGALLALLAPALLASELALLAVASRGGWLGAKLRAQSAVLRTLPMALRRRRAIQARGSARRAFVAGLSDSLDSPFLPQIPVLRVLQAAYWRVVRGRSVPDALRIGFLGGIPPAMGGGGLEIQMDRTAAALEARGHTVVRVAHAEPGETWDVTHAFGAEGDVQHVLDHWTRGRTPLVLSPVIVASPGLDEAAVVLGARVPGIATHAGLRRRALLRAQVLVAITEYERRVIGRLVGGSPRIEVVANGVDRVEPAGGEGPSGHVLLLGSISERKRQREVVEALMGEPGIVVAGTFAGRPEELPAWEATIARAGAQWLGQVSDPAEVARLERDAAVLVHVSRAEVQSLAVIETLAFGTPVVLSDIPSHRELAARYPEWVRLARDLEEVPSRVRELRTRRPDGPLPPVPTWADVAGRLEGLYRSLL